MGTSLGNECGSMAVDVGILEVNVRASVGVSVGEEDVHW